MNTPRPDLTISAVPQDSTEQWGTPEPSRHDRLVSRARVLGDVAAVAILEADREHTPDPDRLYDRTWMGLRWSGTIGPREAVWHA